jgi:hypothetical protein
MRGRPWAASQPVSPGCHGWLAPQLPLPQPAASCRLPDAVAPAGQQREGPPLPGSAPCCAPSGTAGPRACAGGGPASAAACGGTARRRAVRGKAWDTRGQRVRTEAGEAWEGDRRDVGGTGRAAVRRTAAHLSLHPTHSSPATDISQIAPLHLRLPPSPPQHAPHSHFSMTPSTPPRANTPLPPTSACPGGEGTTRSWRRKSRPKPPAPTGTAATAATGGGQMMVRVLSRGDRRATQAAVNPTTSCCQGGGGAQAKHPAAPKGCERAAMAMIRSPAKPRCGKSNP